MKSQTDALLGQDQEFVDAVKAGDIDKAKTLFPVARTYWERIEPVAESFGDLDPAIDAREADLEEGQEWTGFHRIEKDLWITKDISKDGPIADKLITDVKTIVDEVQHRELSPAQLANGAKELLDEVATGKITGEEDTFSHTDLWDFEANLEGSQGRLARAPPGAGGATTPTWSRRSTTKFAARRGRAGQAPQGDGWKLHNELSKAELKALADAINALAEPISKVAAVVGGRV